VTTPIHSLMTLLQHAQSERDAADGALQRAQAAADRAKLQAEQLLTYRCDYERRWNEQFAQGGTIDIVRCYQNFMQRLSQAIEQQQHSAQHSARQAQLAIDALRSHEMRVASIRKLIERRTKELQAVAARNEQKAADEQAAQQAWQREPSAIHSIGAPHR
jgi:flagellar protein FliJ